jgi:glycosyltransferase involved in cell wall biosynthesis
MTLVSVIIPTHDRPELVLRAVKSALNQTFKDIEVIVVDDVGTAPIEEFKQLGVQYIRIPETYWISDNRNTGIKYSKGKYIALLDDDDIWFEDYLETLIPIMESDPSIGLACTNGYQINDFNEKPTRQLFPHIKKVMKGNLFAKTVWDCFMLPSLTIIRKDMFNEVGLFRHIRGEDLDIIMRVSAFTNVYYTPKICGVWYRRLDTSSASNTAQSTLIGRLNILMPMLVCLTEIKNMAEKYGREFSLTERFVLYYQKYYFSFYIVSVYFMFKDAERYKVLWACIKLYPFLTPMTILAPLCQIKFIRDIGQSVKRRML